MGDTSTGVGQQCAERNDIRNRNGDSVIYCRPADLDDWPAIKQLQSRFGSTKAAGYISASIPELSAYLCNSLVRPDVMGMLLLFYHDKLVGLASLCIIQQPSLGQLGTPMKAHAFINAVYIEPTIRHAHDTVPIPRGVGEYFCHHVEQWGAARGADWIYGNVREGGPLNAFQRKYGFEVLHHIIGKEIRHG